MYVTVGWLEADAKSGFARGRARDAADGEPPQMPGDRPFQDGSFSELIGVQPTLDDDQSQIRE